MANANLNQAILQAVTQLGLNRFGKSPAWNMDQLTMDQEAYQAGLPVVLGNPEESSARLRLQDAIARSQGAGYTVPHFIGTPNEPTGDRGISMDVEQLVGSLGAQLQAAVATGDVAKANAISKELAYWQNQASQGMTAAEWKAQTGEDDPVYPAR